MPVITYIKEIAGEMTHVQWPSRRQTLIYTLLVVIISLVTAAYIGVFDHLFSTLIKFLSR